MPLALSSPKAGNHHDLYEIEPALTQHNHKGAQGYIVEHLHQESRDMYEKLISAKDEQIALLKDIPGEKKSKGEIIAVQSLRW